MIDQDLNSGESTEFLSSPTPEEIMEIDDRDELLEYVEKFSRIDNHGQTLQAVLKRINELMLGNNFKPTSKPETHTKSTIWNGEKVKLKDGREIYTTSQIAIDSINNIEVLKVIENKLTEYRSQIDVSTNKGNIHLRILEYQIEHLREKIKMLEDEDNGDQIEPQTKPKYPGKQVGGNGINIPTKKVYRRYD